MKFSTLIGILSSLFLIASCFAPWTYYPDIDQTFTGFYSAQNYYGHPGKALFVLSLLCMACFVVPRIWAKRVNLLFSVITFSFAIKSYLLFTSCYRGICPEKQWGIFAVMLASLAMMVAAVLPDLKLKESK